MIGDIYTYKSKNSFHNGGGFYYYTGKVFDLILASLYWLIGSLPILTVGASFAALFYTVNKSIRNDTSTVTKIFWHAYRVNMKSGIKLWIGVLVAIFLVLLNIGILREKTVGNLMIFFMLFYGILCTAIIAMACYLFPLLSRFEMPVGWFVKVALYLCVKNLHRTLLLLLLFFICYVSIYKQFFLVVFLPGVCTWLSTYLLEPVLIRHVPKNIDSAT